MSEIKMSYVENVPPMRGCKHDWLTMLSELINSGHHAIKLECEDGKKAGRVSRAITQACKTAGYDLIVMQRKSDVYIVNEVISAKK